MKYTTLLILCCSWLMASSQITLDKTNVWMPMNYEYKHNVNNPMYDVTTIDPTPAGANVTWDFSNITVPIVEGITAICVDPKTTPFADSIPEANLCIKNKDSIDGPYQYILQQNDKTELLAMGWYEGGNTSFTRYKTGNTILELPTSFGSSYEDYFSFVMYNSGIPFMIDTTFQIIEADAYGTVITPFATYTNVLRIKRKATTQTYINIGAGWNKTTLNVLIEYQWFKSGIPTTIMSVSEFNGDKKYMINYRASNASTSFEQKTSNNNLHIFPNPATDHINILCNGPGKKVIELYAIDGSSILKATMESKKYQLNMSSFDVGYYIIKVKCEEETYTRKILKKG